MKRRELVVEEGDGFQRFVIPCGGVLSAAAVQHSKELAKRIARDNERWRKERNSSDGSSPQELQNPEGGSS